MKNFNDTIGNRTRDLPTCSAVPQPTALPRAVYVCKEHKLKWVFNKFDTDWFDDNFLGRHGNKPHRFREISEYLNRLAESF